MGTKHRPYLTEQAIFWITEKAKELRDTDPLAAAVYKELAPLALKLDMGEVVGSYTTTDRKSMMDKLGGAEEASFTDPMIAKVTNYTKYSQQRDECSEQEVLDALEYKELVLKETLTEEERVIIDESWGM